MVMIYLLVVLSCALADLAGLRVLSSRRVRFICCDDFRVVCELCRHWGLSRRTGAKQNCARGVEERRGRSRFFAGAKQNGAGAKQNGGGEEEVVSWGCNTKRLLKYMMDNNYIDTSIQKGGVPGCSGCIEHTSILSQLIQEAKAGKKVLAIVWLDLQNAYGSVPHQLIKVALEKYYVPEPFQHTKGSIVFITPDFSLAE
ncbi:hypothetical protein Bbelb_155690 [Branchiostoma belcheri]|nr:hypothetical protein Bbelb_155690 [Branchiostoma belcheri]